MDFALGLIAVVFVLIALGFGGVMRRSADALERSITDVAEMAELEMAAKKQEHALRVRQRIEDLDIAELDAEHWSKIQANADLIQEVLGVRTIRRSRSASSDTKQSN